MMSQKKFKAKGGGICPSCESEEADCMDTEVYNGGVSHWMSCMDCNSTWNEVYTLKNYSDLTIGKKDE